MLSRPQLSLHRLGHVGGKVFEVLFVKTCHGDTAVSGAVAINMEDQYWLEFGGGLWGISLQVDGRLGGESVDCLGFETGEGEHPDLVRDVVPAPWGVLVLEHYHPSPSLISSHARCIVMKLIPTLLQPMPHRDDPVSHPLDFGQPLGTKGFILQDLADEPRSAVKGVCSAEVQISYD